MVVIYHFLLHNNSRSNIYYLRLTAVNVIGNTIDVYRQYCYLGDIFAFP
jgi:hypothetical protein